jgi:hypothetical protein
MPSQAVEEDFYDLVYSDSELLRLDFDELTATEAPSAAELPRCRRPHLLPRCAHDRGPTGHSPPLLTPAPAHRGGVPRPADTPVSERSPPVP